MRRPFSIVDFSVKCHGGAQPSEPRLRVPMCVMSARRPSGDFHFYRTHETKIHTPHAPRALPVATSALSRAHPSCPTRPSSGSSPVRPTGSLDTTEHGCRAIGVTEALQQLPVACCRYRHAHGMHWLSPRWHSLTYTECHRGESQCTAWLGWYQTMRWSNERVCAARASWAAW